MHSINQAYTMAIYYHQADKPIYQVVRVFSAEFQLPGLIKGM
jgi:hypothetical protein